MHQQLSRQALTSRQSFENSHSKKTKSIKSIRIIDQQNHSPHTKYEQQHAQTARSSSPHEFSFKKQYPNRTSTPESADEYLLKDKLFCQEEELKKLERMLKSMTGKLQSQQQQFDELKPQYEEYVREARENGQLKKEICDLKDLMKELLIEKEKDRMMVFYQDS